MTPEYIAPTVDPRVRYIVVALDGAFLVYRSVRDGGRWRVALETGEGFAMRGAAVARADALARTVGAA